MPIVEKQAPIPVWANELDGYRKVVFVTRGTLSNQDFTEFVAPALSALENDADRTEDKADVNARGEWSGAGIDLKTSTPTAEALAKEECRRKFRRSR